MPCMGADCDAAAKRGEDAYEKILMMLERDYHLLLDTSHSKESWPELRVKAKQDLRAALKELFIAEACDTW